VTLRLGGTLTEERRALAVTARPGLGVTLDAAVTGEPAALRVRVDVAGGQGPVRMFLYVDGELMESWMLVSVASRFLAPDLAVELAEGRHLLTARAIDATGRWGGASSVLDLETAPAARG
jgi:hypothetical protein